MKSITYNSTQITPHYFENFGLPTCGFFDTDIEENVWLYFGLKNKHDAYLTNKEELLFDIQQTIESINFNANVVVCPQSSKDLNSWLSNIIARKNNSKIIELKKRSKDEIIELVKKQSWTKDEWSSQLSRFDVMGLEFEINKVKSNQRKKYIPYLFEPQYIDSTNNVMLVDDSIFSGTTVMACNSAIGYGIQQLFALFWCGNLLK